MNQQEFVISVVLHDFKGLTDESAALLFEIFDDGVPVELSDGTVFVDVARLAASEALAAISVMKSIIDNLPKLGNVTLADSELLPVSAIATELKLSRDVVYKHIAGKRGNTHMNFPPSLSGEGRVAAYPMWDVRQYFELHGTTTPDPTPSRPESASQVLNSLVRLGSELTRAGADPSPTMMTAIASLEAVAMGEVHAQ